MSRGRKRTMPSALASSFDAASTSNGPIRAGGCRRNGRSSGLSRESSGIVHAESRRNQWLGAAEKNRRKNGGLRRDANGPRGDPAAVDFHDRNGKRNSLLDESRIRYGATAGAIAAGAAAAYFRGAIACDAAPDSGALAVATHGSVAHLSPRSILCQCGADAKAFR